MTKIRNIFSNNISRDLKVSKAEIPKTNKSGRSFGSCLDNLGKKTLLDLDIPLVRDKLPGLVSNLASNAKNEFKIKICRTGAVITEKGLFQMKR